MIKSTDQDVQYRKEIAELASEAIMIEMAARISLLKFTCTREIEGSRFKHVWKYATGNASVELLGSVHVAACGRQVELIEHVYFREAAAKPDSPMKELAVNDKFWFVNSSDLGSEKAALDYLTFTRIIQWRFTGLLNRLSYGSLTEEFKSLKAAHIAKGRNAGKGRKIVARK